jgi:hypothetical protein
MPLKNQSFDRAGIFEEMLLDVDAVDAVVVETP